MMVTECPITRVFQMPDKDLNALFLHQLRDTYYAENAIAKALPKFADAAKTTELRAALTIHAEETRNQVRRLDEVFKLLDANPEGIECKAIEGILAEGDEVIDEFSGGAAIDAGLISAAQAVEHYEITRYGTLLAWAKQLELDDVSGLLEETLVEEENTDELLSELAEELANPTAAGAAAA
jgi:ferritin-like metal-binding protein YciE